MTLTKDEQIAALTRALRQIATRCNPESFEQITQHQPDGTYTIFGKRPEQYWRAIAIDQYRDAKRLAYQGLEAAKISVSEQPASEVKQPEQVGQKGPGQRL